MYRTDIIELFNIELSGLLDIPPITIIEKEKWN